MNLRLSKTSCAGCFGVRTRIVDRGEMCATWKTFIEEQLVKKIKVERKPTSPRQSHRKTSIIKSRHAATNWMAIRAHVNIRVGRERSLWC